MTAGPANSLPSEDVHEKLMAVLKRRGYIAPSYEIYGGVAGFYDFGPLGATFKQNVQNLWRSIFVLREGMAEIECPNVSPEPVFRASGHLEKFADTVIECAACGTGSRGDHLVKGEYKRFIEKASEFLAKHGAAALAKDVEAAYEPLRASADRDPSPENLRRILSDASVLVARSEGNFRIAGRATRLAVEAGKHKLEEHVVCPGCAKPLDVAAARIAAFNLMFRTTVGPGSGRVAYLRPETAQGMFMDFDWLYRFFREKLPFGAVQIGRAYRNEISPRQAMLRLREFNQMEAEVFFDPASKTWPRFAELADRELNLLAAGESEPRRWRMSDAVSKGVIANGALGYFVALTDVFLTAAGVRKDILRFRQHEPTEKAHYSTDTWDAEFYSARFGWVEIVGIADRTDYDLKAHERVSGVRLKALRRYPEAREVEVNKVVPLPAKLGPLFKGKASKIAEALRALHPDHVEGIGELVVAVDGESLRVPADAFRVERGRERVEGEHYTPHVVEPSFGIDRIVYAILEASYAEKEWVTLRLPATVAPVKCGVFPLMAKDGLDALAANIERDARRAGLLAQYDDSGSIGKRYARQDEIGTPFCVTVDYDTKKDGTVTIRERDSGAQKRVARADVVGLLAALARGDLAFNAIPGPMVAASG